MMTLRSIARSGLVRRQDLLAEVQPVRMQQGRVAQVRARHRGV